MAAHSSKTRFASFDDNEFDGILQDRNALNTKRATKQAANILKEYIAEKNLQLDLETVDKKTLASVLAKFYVEVRQTDGTHYKTTTLNSIQAGLNRYMKS